MAPSIGFFGKMNILNFWLDVLSNKSVDSDRPNISIAAASAAFKEKEDQKISKVGVLTLQQTIADLNSWKNTAHLAMEIQK